MGRAPGAQPHGVCQSHKAVVLSGNQPTDAPRPHTLPATSTTRATPSTRRPHRWESAQDRYDAAIAALTG